MNNGQKRGMSNLCFLFNLPKASIGSLAFDPVKTFTIPEFCSAMAANADVAFSSFAEMILLYGITIVEWDF